MATLFACPSPSCRNDARLYLDSKGRLLDRRGAYWGKSQIRKMALDAALPGPEWNERSDGVHLPAHQAHGRAEIARRGRRSGTGVAQKDH
jgi:hypothetical protein